MINGNNQRNGNYQGAASGSSCDPVTWLYTEVKQLDYVVCATSKETESIDKRLGTKHSIAPA